MTRRLSNLADHHHKMLRLIEQARPLITPALQDANVGELRRLRDLMVRALISYQLFVHAEIFSPALRSGNQLAIKDAQALKIGCIEVQRDYDMFGTRWLHRDICESWQDYRAEAFTMMSQLEAHIANARMIGTSWTVAEASAGV